MTLFLKSKARADGETEFSAFGMLRALMEGRTHSSMKRHGGKSWEAKRERVGKPG